MDLNARILVLGHRGFIGSAILRRLSLCGFNNVIGASRSEIDLENDEAVKNFFPKMNPDYVFLCAGTVGGINQNQLFPADFIFSNLAIQLNTLRHAHIHGIKKFILFASSCIYPRHINDPMAETAILSGLLEPTSMPYAVSKLAGLQMCLALNKQYNSCRFIPVIPNSVYGPNDNFDPESSHVLSALMHRIYQAKKCGDDSVLIWGTGSPKREFIYVDDVADAAIQLMCLQDIPDGPFNIGVGSDISIIDLAHMLASVIGYRGKFVFDHSKPDGSPRKLLDSTKINNTGWIPKIMLEEGILRTFEWYMSHQQTGCRSC